jgi:hypothetical protein
MLPDTVIGVLVLVVAVLPGLVYTITFERQASGFGVTLADRTLRFVAVSVIFHVLAGWLEYWVYRVTLADRGPILSGEFALLWLGVVLLVAIPALVGTVIGGLYKTRRSRTGWSLIRRRLPANREQRLLRLILGPVPAPRAWDDFFSSRPDTYIRVRTTDGTLLAGLFANRSYAAGFPNSPDLLLEEAWRVSRETGELVEPLGYPLYVAAGQIAWLEIVRPEQGEKGT